MKNIFSKVLFHLNRLWTRRRIVSQKYDSQQSVFNKIYNSRYWGDGETVSGSGSTLEYTQNIRFELPKLVDKYSIESIFDAPCGDYNWFQKITWSKPIEYLGADIVKDLVDQNNKSYAGDSVAFIHSDLVADSPPSIGENSLWHCRDCLFHLPLESITSILKHFALSDIPYMITSCHYEADQNKDIQAGDFRSIDLRKPPFNLPEPIDFFDDYPEGVVPRFMGLWTREQVCSALGLDNQK